MVQTQIILKDFQTIKKFYDVVCRFEEDININKLDAKSLMGILSIDTTKATTVTMINGLVEHEQKFLEAMKEFEV